MRRYQFVSILRWFAAILSVILAVVAFVLWRQQTAVELGYQYTCDLPPLSRIGPDCIKAVPVPVLRNFTVETNKDNIVGAWTTHAVSAGEMVHPGQLTHESPENFRFRSGRRLPDGTWGYFLNVPDPPLGVIGPGNQLSLSVVDADAKELIVVMDHVPVLYKTDGGVYIALTQEQVAALERLRNDLADSERNMYTLWTIDQPANIDLPPLTTFEMTVEREKLP